VAPLQISTGFAYWLYSSDVAHRWPTKLARCLAITWAATLYIGFRGILPPNGILPGAKMTLRPSLAFTYIGRFCRGRHLYLAGWPSLWALAHILVVLHFGCHKMLLWKYLNTMIMPLLCYFSGCKFKQMNIAGITNFTVH